MNAKMWLENEAPGHLLVLWVCFIFSYSTLSSLLSYKQTCIELHPAVVSLLGSGNWKIEFSSAF